MPWLIFLSSYAFLLCIKGQTTEVPHYFCNEDRSTVEFTLFTSFHSAWQPSSNCSLLQCSGNPSSNNSCLLPATPCFAYHTVNNTNLCAPGFLCSILEPCNNVTYDCASNTSLCIINSCCSPQAVCLPLLFTGFCAATFISTTDSTTTTTTTDSTATATTTTMTTTTTP